MVTSEQPSPLGWRARVVAAVSVCHPEQARIEVVMAMQYGISPRESNFREWCKPERKAKNASHFLRVWECLSIQLFSVLTVTNKQFFSLGKVHQTRLISLNLLTQVSVLLHPLRSFRKTSTHAPRSLRMTTAPGDGQGPIVKDSTAVGGIANATGDRKGPIPSIIKVQKKKTHTESSFFGAGDGNRTRTVSLGS